MRTNIAMYTDNDPRVHLRNETTQCKIQTKCPRTMHPGITTLLSAPQTKALIRN